MRTLVSATLVATALFACGQSNSNSTNSGPASSSLADTGAPVAYAQSMSWSVTYGSASDQGTMTVGADGTAQVTVNGMPTGAAGLMQIVVKNGSSIAFRGNINDLLIDGSPVVRRVVLDAASSYSSDPSAAAASSASSATSGAQYCGNQQSNNQNDNFDNFDNFDNNNNFNQFDNGFNNNNNGFNNGFNNNNNGFNNGFNNNNNGFNNNNNGFNNGFNQSAFQNGGVQTGIQTSTPGSVAPKGASSLSLILVLPK